MENQKTFDERKQEVLELADNYIMCLRATLIKHINDVKEDKPDDFNNIILSIAQVYNYKTGDLRVDDIEDNKEQ